MNYLYKSAGLLLIHILALFVLFYVFPKSVPMMILVLIISIIFSILYIAFGYKAYEYGSIKLGGILFVIIGCVGILASILAAVMSLTVQF